MRDALGRTKENALTQKTFAHMSSWSKSNSLREYVNVTFQFMTCLVKRKDISPKEIE